MKRSLFFMLISLPILFFSCVGEDVNNFPIEPKPLNITEAPFSVIFDGETGGQRGQLGIFTNFDDDETVQLIWESSDESLLQIDNVNQIVVPVSTKDDIGKTITISGKAYNKSDISIEEGTSKITINAEALPIAELLNPIEILIGRVNLNRGGAANLANTGIDVRAGVINGFEEMLEITEFVTSIDINDKNIPPLRARFIDFQKSLKGSLVRWSSSDTSILEIDQNGNLTPIAKGTATITATVPNEFTDGDTARTESIEIEVSDETVVVVVEPEPKPEPTRTVIGFGNFERLDYNVSGGFEIVQNGNTLTLELNSSYSTSSLPDNVIYLSNTTSSFANALFISEDITARGAQSFVIPEGTNVNDYQFVLMFCRRFNQPIGFGRIQR